MSLNTEANNSHYVIRRYQDGELLINKETYSNSLFIYGDYLAEWPVADIAALESCHLDTLLKHEPEVIILGTGQKMSIPTRELIHQAGLAKVGLEFMNTEQACRTYNLLASDGREVLGAFIL